MSYHRLNDDNAADGANHINNHIELQAPSNLYPAQHAVAVRAQPLRAQPMPAVAVVAHPSFVPNPSSLPEAVVISRARRESDGDMALRIHQQLNGAVPVSSPQAPQVQLVAQPVLAVPLQPLPVQSVQYHYPQAAQGQGQAAPVVAIARAANPSSEEELRARISRTATVKASPLMKDAWTFYKLNCCSLTCGMCMWVMLVFAIIAAAVGGAFVVVGGFDAFPEVSMIVEFENDTQCGDQRKFASLVPISLPECQQKLCDDDHTCKFINFYPPINAREPADVSAEPDWWAQKGSKGMCVGFDTCDTPLHQTNTVTFKNIFEEREKGFAICPNDVLLPSNTVLLPDFDTEDQDEMSGKMATATCLEAANLCMSEDSACTDGEMRWHDVQRYFRKTNCCAFAHYDQDQEPTSPLERMVESLSGAQLFGIGAIAVVAGLLLLLIFTAAPASYLAAIFEALRSNSKVRYSHFFSCFTCPYFCKLLALFIVSQVLIRVGFMAFFFPGAVLSVLFMYTLPLHREHAFLGVCGSLRFSSTMVWYNLCSTLLFLVAGICAVAAGFFSLVGWVVVIPYTTVAYALLYHHIAGINGVPTVRAPNNNHLPPPPQQPVYAFQQPGVVV